MSLLDLILISLLTSTVLLWMVLHVQSQRITALHRFIDETLEVVTVSARAKLVMELQTRGLITHEAAREFFLGQGRRFQKGGDA